MFQLGPNLWLQAFSSPGLTRLMEILSAAGILAIYVPVLLALSLAVRLRPALGALLGLLLAAAMTGALKSALALPRPGDVDAALLRPGRVSARPLAPAPGAAGFWSLPSARATAAARSAPSPSYGFPSGHTSEATAFCLGLAAFFKRRRLMPFVVGWPILVALSRMYLGWHFLGDVLGGFAVGAMAVGLAALWLAWVQDASRSRARRRLAISAALAIAIAVLALAEPSLGASNAGRLVGVVAAFATFTFAGFPTDEGTPAERATRLAAAIFLYAALTAFLHLAIRAAGWSNLDVANLVAAALTVCGTLLGGVALGRRLGGYRTVH